ncbi:MAG: class I SAM-dependent methyltransferase [Mycobacterium sp.]
MSVDLSTLTPVEQTAFLTLYARALDSRWDTPILGDTLANRVAARIDYDFAGLGVEPSVVCQTSLRAKMLDERVRRFIVGHPDAVVIDLGGGLDSAVYRVDPPPSVEWYSIDLPAVSALRREVLAPREHTHTVAASVADPGWPATIVAGRRPVLLRADGLFAFLDEPVIAGIFQAVTHHFRTGQIVFNDYGGLGLLSRAVLKVKRRKMYADVGALYGYRGFTDARHPQSWNPRLHLEEETSLTHEPEVALFPTWVRWGTRLAGLTDAGARKARILRYRF